jgi:hypothetical protein
MPRKIVGACPQMENDGLTKMSEPAHKKCSPYKYVKACPQTEGIFIDLRCPLSNKKYGDFD